MKRATSWILFIALLAVTSGVASAQSLAEIAKKEKERRAANKDQPENVITERDLSSSYGGLREGEPAPADGETAQTGDSSAEGDASQEPTVEDETKTQGYWQNRISAAKEKIARLEQETQDWGDGQRVGVDPRGTSQLARRERAQQDLEKARAELAGIQAEARRAGVPPGWVR